jgi:hypothetical protein
MTRVVALISALSFVLLGCHNTYVVTQEEFAKLQRLPDDTDLVTITDKKGQKVQVKDSTAIYVRSKGGRRYPVTAFNFKISESQLVASDRDTLLMLSGLSTYEVDHVSTWKTVGLVSAGVAAAAGVVLAVIFLAGSKTIQQ